MSIVRYAAELVSFGLLLERRPSERRLLQTTKNSAPRFPPHKGPDVTLAGTKLRSWRARLNAAKRKVADVAAEIREHGDPVLTERMEQADCYLNDAVSILGATIECCRDPRGKRPTDTAQGT